MSRLAEVLGVAAPAPGATQLLYTIDAYPQLRATVARTWLEPTFMIDFDEPAVLALKAELIDQAGEAPAPVQLVDFVAGWVEESLQRGWDIASTVAANLEGDCTEYAVLTAALARAVGIPARVAVGAVLVDEQARFASYGHAWAEFYLDQRWVIADAALAGFDEVVRYVPFGIVEDEGPGFMLTVSARFAPVWIQRVDVLGAASPVDDPLGQPQ